MSHLEVRRSAVADVIDAAVKDLEVALDELVDKIHDEAYAEGVDEGRDQAGDEAYCWNRDVHDEQATDEYGFRPDEIGFVLELAREAYAEKRDWWAVRRATADQIKILEH